MGLVAHATVPPANRNPQSPGASLTPGSPRLSLAIRMLRIAAISPIIIRPEQSGQG